MKKLYFIFLFFYITSGINAQSWCTPGSTWHYELSGMASGYSKYTYLYDTLVGTVTCNKIRVEFHGANWAGPLNSSSYIYTTYQNGVVFKNNGTLSSPQYDTLYYFTGPVGAKWRCQTTSFGSPSPSCSQSYIEITGIGSTVIQGQTINWRKISYKNYYFYGQPMQWMESGTDTLFERIGTRHYMEFISGSYCAEVTDVGPLPFRCFSDNQISIQSSTVACDYTTGIPEVKKPMKALKILQPAHDRLVGTFLRDEYDLMLIDGLGKTVYSNHFYEHDFIINVSDLPQGIYYLEVGSKREQIREKVLIQH